MKVQELLDNRLHELCWSEPWKGLDNEGREKIVTVNISATVKDCLLLARKGLTNGGTKQSDRELLEEFMAVYWATPK